MFNTLGFFVVTLSVLGAPVEEVSFEDVADASGALSNREAVRVFHVEESRADALTGLATALFSPELRAGRVGDRVVVVGDRDTLELFTKIVARVSSAETPASKSSESAQPRTPGSIVEEVATVRSTAKLEEAISNAAAASGIRL
jgi:hypothetical protein